MDKTIKKSTGEVLVQIIPANPGFNMLWVWQEATTSAPRVARAPILAWGAYNDPGEPEVHLEPMMVGDDAVYSGAIEQPDGSVLTPYGAYYPTVEEWLVDYAKNNQKEQNGNSA